MSDLLAIRTDSEASKDNQGIPSHLDKFYFTV